MKKKDRGTPRRGEARLSSQLGVMGNSLSESSTTRRSAPLLDCSYNKVGGRGYISVRYGDITVAARTQLGIPLMMHTVKYSSPCPGWELSGGLSTSSRLPYRRPRTAGSREMPRKQSGHTPVAEPPTLQTEHPQECSRRRHDNSINGCCEFPLQYSMTTQSSWL